MLEIAGGILLALAILALLPVILGVTIGIALLAKIAIPYLLLTAFAFWLVYPRWGGQVLPFACITRTD